MSSGTGPAARRAPERWLILLFWLLPLAAPAAPAWDLPALMHALAAEPPGRLPFREQRWSAYLDAPIELRGELIRTPEGRLGKQVASPEPITYWIDAADVRVERPNEAPQEIAADAEPGLAALVAGFYATLRGDLPTLERHYTLKLSGSESAWRLLLTPKSADTARLLERIQIEGHGGRPTLFAIFERNGDHSRMELGAP